MGLVRRVKEREVIKIGDNIRLAVVFISRGHVKLDIVAPGMRIECGERMDGEHEDNGRFGHDRLHTVL